MGLKTSVRRDPRARMMPGMEDFQGARTCLAEAAARRQAERVAEEKRK